MVKKIEDLRVKIFADGAEKTSMVELAAKPYVKGLTTNPTLMRKAGVTDYVAFAKDVLSAITDKPLSFEVFSDDFTEMERQARLIASWAGNVYVKIPITNTKGESSFELVKKLAADGIKLNLTAIFTLEQTRHIIGALNPDVSAFISIFAGRIADTGENPVPIMKEAKALLAPFPKYELLWASTRELYNIYEAESVDCEIITVTPDILKKLDKIGYDLAQFSKETVQMFYDDGEKAGYKL